MDKDVLKSLIQYKSNEMIPSTQLIRKSKLVFDSIQNKDIEKAVILRDGKPSFILMDFKKYEEIIDYFLNKNISIDSELELLEEINTKEKEVKISKEIKQDINKQKEEKKSSLLEKLDSIEGIINNDKTNVQENLKDFWE
ncbi:conserved hypothetical protein [Arcobacter nitrofigilis DSM 7299]|uniref:Prevent-host-death family protein n=1 Tax=Arcobacter nitrofigilis (strain ATCC 33309 / DSM 7299 / CCUG 15893 / LMG 7604 / NCTC 12251 / CI) TaxID=572480 RepID=D5V477_ARCNC|nr:hypothetical protein [Arcobacter nitrofigilis]ADG91810.1 conserved hypothetical protein [Arcobacter nitrofigilis DSM 7299]